MIEFVIDRFPELLQKTGEHLLLTGLSTGVAIVIGIPIGIVAARNSVFQRIVFSGAGIIQTIPSLAMLAFLLPFFGIGTMPAIIALILYALLPILRNTCTGIQGIDSSILEAADGVGFSARQRLWLVELPLALPVIVAGIRTAAVIGVGIATLSAFIGAGGLGDFINRGLAMNNTSLILLGAIPSGLLALLIDGVIGCLEKKMGRKKGS